MCTLDDKEALTTRRDYKTMNDATREIKETLFTVVLTFTVVILISANVVF